MCGRYHAQTFARLKASQFKVQPELLSMAEVCMRQDVPQRVGQPRKKAEQTALGRTNKLWNSLRLARCSVVGVSTCECKS